MERYDGARAVSNRHKKAPAKYCGRLRMNELVVLYWLRSGRAAAVGTGVATAVVAAVATPAAASAMTSPTATAAFKATFAIELATAILGAAFWAILTRSTALVAATIFTAKIAAIAAASTATAAATMMAMTLTAVWTAITRFRAALFSWFWGFGFGVAAEEPFQPSEESSLLSCRSRRRRRRSWTLLERPRLPAFPAVAILAELTTFTTVASRLTSALIATEVVAALLPARLAGLGIRGTGIGRPDIAGALFPPIDAEGGTIFAPNLRTVFGGGSLSRESTAFPALSRARAIFRRENFQFWFFFRQRGRSAGGCRGCRGCFTDGSPCFHGRERRRRRAADRCADGELRYSRGDWSSRWSRCCGLLGCERVLVLSFHGDHLNGGRLVGALRGGFLGGGGRR